MSVRIVVFIVSLLIGGKPVYAQDSLATLASDTLALQCKLDLVLQAKTSLSFSYYAIDEDEVGLQFVAAACYKAQQGVRTQIVLERRKSKITENLTRILKEYGIRINYYNRSHVFKRLRNFSWLHDKLLVVDSLYTVLGGRNLNIKYYPSSTDTVKLVDIEVVLKGKAGGDAQKYVNHLMSSGYTDKARVKKIDTAHYNKLKKIITQNIEVFKTRDVKNYDPILYPVSKSQFVNDNYKRWPKSKRIAHLILNTLKQAQKNITIISPYMIPNMRFKHALKKARQRGVEITLVSNSPQASDAKIIAAAYMNDRRKYLKNGIKIYEWNGLKMMHDKLFVVDDSTVIAGSYNFDNLSFRMTSENIVKITDKNFGDTIRQHIQNRLEDCWEVKHRKDKNPYNSPGIARKTKWTRFALRVMPFIRRFL